MPIETRGPFHETWHGFAVRPVVVWVLLVASLLPWRYLVFYSGGIDPVVAGKALVGAAAFALAWFGAPPGAADQFRPRTLVLVLLYLLVGVGGALASGGFVASGILALRAAMVAGTVMYLVASWSPAVLLNSFAVAVGGSGLVLAATGIPAFVAGSGTGVTAGRLTPQLIPVGPNELALLFGIPVLLAVWRMTQGVGRAWQFAALGLFLTLTWLTGSRTGMVSLALAALLVVVLAPRIGLGTVAAVLVMVPAVFYFAAYTGAVSGFFGRGGSENLLTLSSRTVAWRAVFSAHQDFYGHWLGGGLAVKTTPIVGAYANSQVLDSSWVSAYVQSGVLGVLLLAVWALGTMIGAARAASRFSTLWLAIAVFAVLRSFLANGLLDTYVLFAVMLVPALMVDRNSPPGHETDQQVEGQPEREPGENVQPQVPTQVQAAR